MVQVLRRVPMHGLAGAYFWYMLSALAGVRRCMARHGTLLLGVPQPFQRRRALHGRAAAALRLRQARRRGQVVLAPDGHWHSGRGWLCFLPERARRGRRQGHARHGGQLVRRVHELGREQQGAVEWYQRHQRYRGGGSGGEEEEAAGEHDVRRDLRGGLGGHPRGGRGGRGLAQGGGRAQHGGARRAARGHAGLGGSRGRCRGRACRQRSRWRALNQRAGRPADCGL
mmetsp:Transcript_11338/g.35051  ORF Transcript_11338/g.35051 Transcript_11338/m.35051 type:complete len:227 (-) Transcript_11338:102-782(-)